MADAGREIRERLKERLRDPAYREAYADSFLHSSIALQVKALRQQRGWTQKDLARRARTHQSRISQLEQPDGPKTIALLRRVARALDLPLRVRFEGWGDLIEEASTLRSETLERPSPTDGTEHTLSPEAVTAMER